ncbi:Exosome complex component rrp4 [Binucleata daphniae]
MNDQIYVPGEIITTDNTLIKGHGTHTSNQSVTTSTLLGKPNTINKLLVVNPLFTVSYVPQIGDIIVARVTAIYNKKWKLDCNTTQETTLHLSAISLPGVEQRRKLEEDEIKMREYYSIDDLIACEVQKVGITTKVQMRGNKCKKLTSGMLFIMPVMLVRKFKSQFLIHKDVEMVVGLNGYIFVGTQNNFEMLKNVYKYFQRCKSENIVVSEEDIYNL